MLNKHIIERHVGKSDFDLVTRMLADWKDACSTITDPASVIKRLGSEVLEEGENIIVFNRTIGFGYNRWFERLPSNIMRVVYLQFNDMLADICYDCSTGTEKARKGKK